MHVIGHYGESTVECVIFASVVVLHIRDHEELDFSAQKYHQSQISYIKVWQYWLGIAKPKNAFRVLPKHFQQKFLWNF